MSVKILHVLCEGQTEQGFVENVLKPYLLANGYAAVKSILVTTSKKKNAHGGVVSYLHVKNDLGVMLKSSNDNESERHIFTTMFDLYALPDNFPGYAEAHAIADRYERVATFERAFANSILSERFIPYIQLHEYEALVFCGLDYLGQMYKGCEKNIGELKSILEKIGNPELVNDRPDSAPSKRIIKAIEGNKKIGYSYDKPKAGKFVAEKVGIVQLRAQCSHFNSWIETLINK